jgi:hypothetical protein
VGVWYELDRLETGAHGRVNGAGSTTRSTDSTRVIGIVQVPEVRTKFDR